LIAFYCLRVVFSYTLNKSTTYFYDNRGKCRPIL